MDIWRAGMDALPEELRNQFGRPVFESSHSYGKGSVKIRFREKVVELRLINLSSLGRTTLGFVKGLVRDPEVDRGGYFLMVPMIYPKIAVELVELGVNFLDTAGNMYLNVPEVYILRTGRKAKEAVEGMPKGRMFSEAGIKLLFGMLQGEDFMSLPYREAAMVIGVSPATISIVARELAEGGWLYESRGKRVLAKKGELLRRWAMAYYEKLRPKLLVGRYETRAVDIRHDFKRLDIGQWGGRWSGEAAANLYTGYLSPEIVGMFVPQESKGWMPKLKLLPVRQKGELEVFRMFWDAEHPVFRETERNVVPPILVYAELMGSNDSRNIETAQRIFDEYIQFTD